MCSWLLSTSVIGPDLLRLNVNGNCVGDATQPPQLDRDPTGSTNQGVEAPPGSCGRSGSRLRNSSLHPDPALVYLLCAQKVGDRPRHRCNREVHPAPVEYRGLRTFLIKSRILLRIVNIHGREILQHYHQEGCVSEVTGLR